MELLFGEFIKQLIAAILAIFMPFSTVAPAVSEAAKSQITITRPPVVAKSEEVTTVDAVQTWDVSDTESDNVTMSYYDADAESVIDTITSSITSLFAPMTAYAAETEATAQTHADGTVVISGTGATEDYIFMKWLDADKFVPYYEDWCANNNIREGSYYVERGGIDENGMIVGKMETAEDAHRGFESYEEMLYAYTPVNIMQCVASTPNFWEEYATFNPKHVIIEGDVTTISSAAFAFCTNIEDITINSNVVAIEFGAFAGTGVSEVKFPATLETLGDGAFTSCTKLNAVYLPENVANIGSSTFSGMSANSTIYCQTENVAALLQNSSLANTNVVCAPEKF